MAGDEERRRAFELRFLELKRKMEAGLLTRAHTLREAVQRLQLGDESARRVLKVESHKLRGIAGSYGYAQLTELAAEVEQRASLSPPPQLGRLAAQLADAAEEVGKRSVAEQAERAPPTAAPEPATDRVQLAAAHPTPGATPTQHATTGKQRTLQARPQIEGATGGPLRVLAMDDDPTTLRLLRLTLADVGGFDATLVAAGHNALDEMRVHHFDVVISDAMMPDMNGKEFCAAARELGGYAASVPIIILSAATQDELRWQNELVGPVAWLRKPFVPTALVKDVARIVLQHRARA